VLLRGEASGKMEKSLANKNAEDRFGESAAGHNKKGTTFSRAQLRYRR
jgi:hypothetical protein